jgi:hypothetical protein
MLHSSKSDTDLKLRHMLEISAFQLEELIKIRRALTVLAVIGVLCALLLCWPLLLGMFSLLFGLIPLIGKLNIELMIFVGGLFGVVIIFLAFTPFVSPPKIIRNHDPTPQEKNAWSKAEKVLQDRESKLIKEMEDIFRKERQSNSQI